MEKYSYLFLTTISIIYENLKNKYIIIFFNIVITIKCLTQKVIHYNLYI